MINQDWVSSMKWSSCLSVKNDAANKVTEGSGTLAEPNGQKPAARLEVNKEELQ
jgi:hypothetical protein